jgi:hypothetical protein
MNIYFLFIIKKRKSNINVIQPSVQLEENFVKNNHQATCNTNNELLSTNSNDVFHANISTKETCLLSTEENNKNKTEEKNDVNKKIVDNNEAENFFANEHYDEWYRNIVLQQKKVNHEQTLNNKIEHTFNDIENNNNNNNNTKK